MGGFDKRHSTMRAVVLQGKHAARQGLKAKQKAGSGAAVRVQSLCASIVDESNANRDSTFRFCVAGAT
jgi:hypothetical protein